jgi:hypothetical protein
MNPKLSFPKEPIADQAIERSIQLGIEEGLKELAGQLRNETAMASEWAYSGFQGKGR